MREMNVDELAALHDNLSDLVSAGKEEEAREYLCSHLPRLPEELKNQILGFMFFEAIVDEAREIEGVAKMQKDGISAIQALQALKKELRAKKESPSES